MLRLAINNNLKEKKNNIIGLTLNKFVHLLNEIATSHRHTMR